MAKELTDAQIKQIDLIHNVAYSAMCALFDDKEIEWDIEWIGQIADVLADVAVYYFGKTEMEIYPYIDED